MQGQPATGDTEQALDFRQVLKLAIRTLPYLKSARRDLWRLFYAALVITPVIIVAWMLMTDLFLNRLLGAEPVTEFQASLLLLDPALFVSVEALSVSAREILRGRLVGIAVGAVLIAAPIGVALFFYFLQLQQRINQTLRVAMVSQVQAMSLRYHSGARVGDSIYRTYQDSSMVTNLMAMLVRPILPLVNVLFWFLFVFLFDWRLPAMLAALYGLAWLLGRRYGPPLRDGFREARELNSVLTSNIQETLNGIRVVKAYGAEADKQARFDQASTGAFNAAYEARSRLALYGILSFSMAALPPMVAACYLAVLASGEQSLAAGQALAFTGFAVWNLGAYSYAMGRLDRATRHTRGLLTQWGATQDMAVGMDRAFEQVDLEPEVQDEADAVALQGLDERVSFHDVRFGYDPAHPILKGIDLSADAGTITALVGPTGSGKSTLVSLLLRLFNPDEGRIEIDGKDIRGFTVESLRDNISIALQENLLFGTSIRENIRYAVPEASDEQVRQAASIAAADAFIETQPQGYDTPLGERGTKLSTGQRQRLSIARAIIKDTPILILDEPTASLDADTELAVLENLARWGEGRAIFLITHRLSTIRRADQILYLDEGRILEHGSHDELMGRPAGAYRRFVEMEEGREPA